MKNVDVPLWDKGDSTDNYTKGGGRASRMSFEGMIQVDKNVEKVFKLVLGRKPTTRESAYYRISRMEKNDIVAKLLASEEHKTLLESAKKYPKLIEENDQQKTKILKLKSEYESRVKEFEELRKLLKEKNSIITELRQGKDKVYVTDKKILEEPAAYYSKYGERKYATEILEKERSWWDKIVDLFFK